MICGLPPYWEPEKDPLINAIKTQQLMFPHHVSKLAKSFICRLMERKFQQRLGSNENGVEDIKRDPFFANVNWEGVQDKSVRVPLF